MTKLFENDFPIRIRYFHNAKRIKSDFEVQTKKIYFHLQSTPNIIFVCLKKERLRRQIWLLFFVTWITFVTAYKITIVAFRAYIKQPICNCEYISETVSNCNYQYFLRFIKINQSIITCNNNNGYVNIIWNIRPQKNYLWLVQCFE